MTSRISKKMWVCTYHLTNIIEKELWNYHVSFMRDMDIRLKICIIHIKSRDDVMTTWPQFSSVALPGILIYQVWTKSDLQFWRYGALKFAPLVWRHVTLDDVITTTRRRGTSWDGHLSVCQVWSRSEVKTMTKVPCRKKTFVHSQWKNRVQSQWEKWKKNKLDMCLCTNTEVFRSVMCKKRFKLIIA